MAWGRLALLQAARTGDDIALSKMAELFGYESVTSNDDKTTNKDNIPKKDKGNDNLQPEDDKNTKQTSTLPPAYFLRVNKNIPKTHWQNNRPPSPGNNTPLTQKQTGTYSFELPRPLLSMARLLPLLLNSLGQKKEGNRLDHKRLIRQIAHGKALHRIPRLPHQRWPKSLQIIIDTSFRLKPYRADFAFIVEQLKKILGTENVDAIRFYEESITSKIQYCITWPTSDEDEWREWNVPFADVPILILSDLGGDDRTERVRWNHLARQLKEHPAPLLTLSPSLCSSQNKTVCRVFRPTPLNDGTQLPRHPYRNGYFLDSINNAKLQKILTLLSPLPLIDFGLLRRLCDSMQWGSSNLENEIWNHPDTVQTSLGMYLKKNTAEQYDKRYQKEIAGTEKADTLWRIVRNHHKHAYEGLHQLERLSRSVVEERNDPEMQLYYQQLCSSIIQSGNNSDLSKSLQAQGATVLNLKPQQIWKSDCNQLAYDLYALVHAEDIRHGKWKNRLEQGFDPQKVPGLLEEYADDKKIRWFIAQTGVCGQFTIQKHTPGREIVTPIAEFEAYDRLPPILHKTKQVSLFVNNGQEFEINEKNTVQIESVFSTIELEAIHKPSWAVSLCADNSGLRASISWRNSLEDIKWQTAKSDTEKAHWFWPQPFGEDKYGLYADLKVKGITQRFRWIEPGTFLMGSPEDEEDRMERETQHQVTLSKGFWIADTTVTQELWLAVMGENPSRFSDDTNNPVERVSWKDSIEFVKKLNKIIPGIHVKLPTEAQWEYACRAGTSTPFSFGSNITPEQVNYDGNYPYADGAKGPYREKTVPVKSLPCNHWGLYEMHGNVWEWCNDYFGDYSKDPIIDPTGAESGAYRVVRGGSWFNFGLYVRSAFRNWSGPGGRGDDIGLRLALGHSEHQQVRPSR